MHSPRRTYVVSLYNEDKSVVVEAVQREERARLDDLDGLAARIRQWEDEDGASAERPSTSGKASEARPSA
jgi:hypothetical protein